MTNDVIMPRDTINHDIWCYSSGSYTINHADFIVKFHHGGMIEKEIQLFFLSKICTNLS